MTDVSGGVIGTPALTDVPGGVIGASSLAHLGGRVVLAALADLLDGVICALGLAYLLGRVVVAAVADVSDGVICALAGGGEGGNQRRGASGQHASDRHCGSQRLHLLADGHSHCLGPSNLWSLSASAVKQQSHSERVGCPLVVGSTTKVWPVPGIVRHARGPWSSGGAQSATSTRRPAMGIECRSRRLHENGGGNRAVRSNLILVAMTQHPVESRQLRGFGTSAWMPANTRGGHQPMGRRAASRASRASTGSGLARRDFPLVP